MAKPREKMRALQLRREGESVKTIAQKLGVGPSTVSLWVRDIMLTDVQKKRLRAKMIAGGHAGRMRGAQVNKEKKIQEIKRARRESSLRIVYLTKQQLFMLGLGLYWGEGVKAPGSTLAIVNSDPAIITLAMRWFRACYGVEKNRFRPRLFINAVHKERKEVLLRFWTKTLGIPRSQFANPVFIKRANTKVYENHNTYYGVMALRVSRGTALRYRILADLERVSDKIYLPV